MTKVHNEPARTSYPVYDGHGNMIAALSFNRPALGSGGTYLVPGSYGVSIGGERLYDAWGGVRAGQSHGYPNHRYCANLGHVSDDETGLTYMRARYYEPSTGRFISEDPAYDGRNWYVYAQNLPSMLVDPDGRNADGLQHAVGLVMWINGFRHTLLMKFFADLANLNPGKKSYFIKLAKTNGTTAVISYSLAFAGVDDVNGAMQIVAAGLGKFVEDVVSLKIEAINRTRPSKGGIAERAVAAHGLIVLGALIASMIYEPQ